LTKAAWARHKLKATRCKLVVCAFLVHPKWVPSLFLRVDEELAKEQMQQPDRNIFAVRNTKNRVQRVELTFYLLSGALKKTCERGNRKRTLQNNNTANNFFKFVKPFFFLIFLLIE
jgi:hypothetical protein